MKKNRREFLKTTGMAGLSLGITGLQSATLNSAEDKNIRFISPVDGDMLNEYDGILADGKLVVPVLVKAPAGSRIIVNGQEAKYYDGIFTADAVLNNYENVIELAEQKKGYRHNIRVFYLKNFANKYRFSFDDNIWFLQDINTNAGRYTSIFQNPYLGMLKKMHDTYGTKIHLNLFYETDGFNLSRMTDKYKNEWKDNADWIRLSFHALAEMPDKPYINAGYEQVRKDCMLVNEQIKRFAGEELMGPVTTLHWGEATVEACRALRDCGYSVLTSYTMSYYFSEEQRNHINKRYIWRDNREGIIFPKIAIVVNNVKADQIRPHLDNVKDNLKARYIDLMIHEQYFYPHYRGYQPDFQEKIMTAAKWAYDNHFEPGFLGGSVF